MKASDANCMLDEIIESLENKEYYIEDIQVELNKLLKLIDKKSNKKSCVICGCNISLMGYCAGCQTRID